MMTWQEYQEAVAVLYEQADGFGNVRRNVMVPDKVTGQHRQIDVLIEIEAKGHPLKMLVDAKFHAVPIDVREVESVLALPMQLAQTRPSSSQRMAGLSLPRRRPSMLDAISDFFPWKKLWI